MVKNYTKSKSNNPQKPSNRNRFDLFYFNGNDHAGDKAGNVAELSLYEHDRIEVDIVANGKGLIWTRSWKQIAVA